LRYGRTGPSVAGDNDDPDEERWLGPLVLPGTYTVSLAVDGKTFTQPLAIRMDPRCHATYAELVLQFRWAQRAFEDMISARKSLAEIKRLQAQLDKAKSQIAPDQAGALSQIKLIESRVNRILTAGDPASDEGLQFAARGLTVALSSLESADRTPPSQVIALYKQASRILKARLSDWNAFKSSVLPELNRQLRSAGLSAIEISRLEREAEDSLSR
jgi:hypothetical protein